MELDTQDNKYALVTGGSRGIGRVICEKLAEMGYNILVNYNSNEAAALETAKLVEQHNVTAEIIKFDVANKEQVDATLVKWMEDYPEKPIEVLINNAGFRKDALFMWMEEENWDSVLNVNIAGFFNVTKPVFSRMLVHRYGRIINVTSLSGVKGMPGQTNYSAAKAAVIGATKALAQEVGRAKITVNAVAPGFIKTEMTEDLDEKNYRSLIPLRRFGTAEEVADVVAFLASPKSSYITGEVISINGGLHT
jgi:3-oxoacyl-[acyl-carrier protein] reductase